LPVLHFFRNIVKVRQHSFLRFSATCLIAIIQPAVGKIKNAGPKPTYETLNRNGATGTFRNCRTSGAVAVPQTTKALRKKPRGSFDYCSDGLVYMCKWHDNAVVGIASNFLTHEPVHTMFDDACKMHPIQLYHNQTSSKLTTKVSKETGLIFTKIFFLSTVTSMWVFLWG